METTKIPIPTIPSSRRPGQNPYLEQLLDNRLINIDGGGYQDYKDCLRRSMARGEFCKTFAWAIPNNQAIETIARYSPIVEIGAGGGYWAMLLRDKGVDVICYDKNPPNVKLDASKSESWSQVLWSEVLKGGSTQAGKYPDRALFLCWPPYRQNMADNALRHYLKAGGKTIIYVGETKWGCCANEKFFSRLKKNFTLEEYVSIPVWDSIHDQLFVWTRKEESV